MILRDLERAEGCRNPHEKTSLGLKSGVKMGRMIWARVRATQVRSM
jgi:hypothetical protein